MGDWCTTHYRRMRGVLGGGTGMRFGASGRRDEVVSAARGPRAVWCGLGFVALPNPPPRRPAASLPCHASAREGGAARLRRNTIRSDTGGVRVAG